MTYGDKTEAQKEAIRASSRRYYWGHREERLRYAREDNPARKKERLAKSRAKLKAEVYSHYGGNLCACCGETNPGFLSIDHINGGGRQHRLAFGSLGLLYDIKKQGFPPEYQILCYNCNLGRARNGGTCPHKE